MAALATTNPTLLDWTKALDPDGSVAAVIEILNETNEILDDITWMEGNLPTGHRTTVRTGIPAPTWRMMYGGVQPTKSTRAQITDTCGMLEAYAEIDKALYDLNGNGAEFLLQESRGHIEGLSQEVADTLFYGNASINPEEFTGLAPRYSDLSTENADNIIDAGSTDTDNASIWLVVWGPNTVHGIVPKGSQAGLQFNNKGLVTIEDADGSGGRMEAYRSHFRWDVGLSLRDWRYAVRICNIEKSALTSDGASGPVLPTLMFRAMNLIPNLNAGRPVFYMSRDTRTWLGEQTANLVKQSTLTTEMVGGKMVSFFHGIPIRRCDALAADEARVT